MSAWRSAVFVAGLAAAAVLGCQEKVTTQSRCPELCPATKLEMADTLLPLADSADTSVRGFVLIREATYLLASTLDSLQAVTLIRFSAHDSMWTVSGTNLDSLYTGTQDSLVLTLDIAQRDTTVKNLRMVIWRLPAQFDTGATYQSIQPYLADSTLIDTVPVPDTAGAGSHTFNFVDSLHIAPADSGYVSLAIGIVAPTKTALTFGSGNLSVAPRLTTYVHARAPFDTATYLWSVSPFVALFVLNPQPTQPPPGILAIGGIPTSRALLRLSLPKLVVDSASVVRATLLLNTAGAAGGFAGDSFYVVAEPVVRDYGVKSVLWPDSATSGIVLVHQGQTGQIQLDMAPILRFWGTTQGDSTPRLIMLRAYPEGSILGAVNILGRAAGAAGPQLEVTYMKPYSFGVP